MMGRLVIDLSDLYGFLTGESRIAGIQRVVLNFASRIRNIAQYDVVLTYYDEGFSRYAIFPEQTDLTNLDELRGKLRFHRLRQFRPYKYKNRPFRRLFHRNRLRLLRTIEVNLKPRLLGRYARPVPEPFSFEKGDILLSLGAGWDATSMYPIVEPHVRNQTVTPVVLVHDLIPVLGLPERGGLPPPLFEGWLTDVSRFVGRYLTYSEQTKADLSDYLDRISVRDYSIEVFPLPNEFLVADGATPSDSVIALANREYVLFVGPLRLKNGNRLVQAWARLKDQIGTTDMPTLVFAGNGAKSELTVEGIEQIEDLLEFVHRPSDADLEHLYKNSLFTVFPSVYEGFGLPIAESLWFGKFCVASSTSSMPEVGGEMCDYFDPYDIDDMVEALRRPIIDRGYLKRRESQIDHSKLVNWDQSAKRLVAAVHALTATQP